MVQYMQAANVQIDRNIDRGNLAKVLLFREALRSLERFNEADEIRQKLAHFGFMVRDADSLGRNPGFFVILSENDKRYIIDRGWVPTYSLMQQYLLHQCDLVRVLHWMWADSDTAGIGQYPRQAEEPARYFRLREVNPYVRVDKGPGPRKNEDASRGGEGMGSAQPSEAAETAGTTTRKQDELSLQRTPAVCQPKDGDQEQQIAPGAPCRPAQTPAGANAVAVGAKGQLTLVYTSNDLWALRWWAIGTGKHRSSKIGGVRFCTIVGRSLMLTPRVICWCNK
jgi:hypothetical protein